jgi:hypothetical protein
LCNKKKIFLLNGNPEHGRGWTGGNRGWRGGGNRGGGTGWRGGALWSL